MDGQRQHGPFDVAGAREPHGDHGGSGEEAVREVVQVVIDRRDADRTLCGGRGLMGIRRLCIGARWTVFATKLTTVREGAGQVADEIDQRKGDQKSTPVDSIY